MSTILSWETLKANQKHTLNHTPNVQTV